MNGTGDGQTGDVIKIEKGIPIPERTGRGRWVDILNKMEPGDSFLATEKEATAFQKAARKAGYRAVIEVKDKGAVKPVRVWLAEKGGKAKQEGGPG